MSLQQSYIHIWAVQAPSIIAGVIRATIQGGQLLKYGYYLNLLQAPGSIFFLNRLLCRAMMSMP